MLKKIVVRLQEVKMKNNIELQGEMIKKIFEKAEQIADLHAVLTSPTGD